MRKSILLLLIAFLFKASTFAQGQYFKNGQRASMDEETPYINNLFQQAKFIFEGEVISKKNIESKEGGKIYNIKVSKIFYGNLSNSHINLIIQNIRDTQGDVVTVYPVEDFPTPDKGIYFIVPYGNYSDTAIQVRAINTISDLILQIPYDKIIKFNSSQEIYQFIEKYGNINIPKENEEKKIKKKTIPLVQTEK